MPHNYKGYLKILAYKCKGYFKEIGAKIQRLPFITSLTITKVTFKKLAHKFKGYLWKTDTEIQMLLQIMRTQTLSLPQIYTSADTRVFSYVNVT